LFRVRSICMILSALLMGCVQSYKAPPHVSKEAKAVIEKGAVFDELFKPNVLFGGAEAFDRNYFAFSQRELARANITYRAEPSTIGGVPVLIYETDDAEYQRTLTITYLHGGGYITGSARSMPSIPVLLSRTFGQAVVSVDYRTAAAAPFPAAVEDAFAVYRALIEGGVAPQSILMTGDSSGGGLVLATLLKAKAAGLPMPLAAILFSPWLDFTHSGDTRLTLAEDDPFLGFGSGVGDMGHPYVGDAALDNPLISPLFGDLKGLPPILIVVGTKEMLLSDSIRFQRKAKKSGVEVTLDIWDGMWHVFPALPNLPESKEAYKDIHGFVADLLKAH